MVGIIFQPVSQIQIITHTSGTPTSQNKCIISKQCITEIGDCIEAADKFEGAGLFSLQSIIQAIDTTES